MRHKSPQSHDKQATTPDRYSKESSEIIAKSHVCQHCGSHFSAKRKDAKYCSSRCNKAAKALRDVSKLKRQEDRHKTKLSKLANSSFGLWLSSQCKRAGTVEILVGHSKDTLTQLVALKHKATKACSMSDGLIGGEHHLSHIAPVAGKHLGLLNADNLIIVPSQWNLANRKTPDYRQLIAGKHYLTRGSLNARWQVTRDNTVLEVLKLIDRYLGSSFKAWLKSHLIPPTQKQQLCKQLQQHGIKGSLSKMTLEQLKSLALKHGLTVHSFTRSATEYEFVLLDELQRFDARSAFTTALKRITDLLVTFNDLPDTWLTHQHQITEFVVQQSLNKLHQLPYETFISGSHFLQLIPFITEKTHAHTQPNKQQETEEDYI
jgi:hypothetical protein